MARTESDLRELRAFYGESEENVAERVASDFHVLWYTQKLWHTLTWMGVPVLKNPFDLWVYQEIVHRTKPEVIVEFGTAHGGSALYLAHLMSLIGCEVKYHLPQLTRSGSVITVDPDVEPDRPEHPRIVYLRGRSTDKNIREQIYKIVDGRPALVISDSDHTYATTLYELNHYHKLVPEGGYFIVEDTNLGGFPIARKRGRDTAGHAVTRFLSKNPEFKADPECERLLFTFNPGGYLRRDNPFLTERAAL